MLSRLRLFLYSLGLLLSAVVLIVGIFGGALLLAYEAYDWLRTGHWTLHSIVTLMQMDGDAWARDPHDWIGLHDLLSAIPLFLLGPALAAVFARLLREGPPAEPQAGREVEQW